LSKKFISFHVEEIRCGKFATQLGFLTIRDVSGWVQDFPKKSKTRDPNFEMPIVACAWDGSGYKPVFQSLN
jgi:hypothetical protein